MGFFSKKKEQDLGKAGVADIHLMAASATLDLLRDMKVSKSDDQYESLKDFINEKMVSLSKKRCVEQLSPQAKNELVAVMSDSSLSVAERTNRMNEVFWKGGVDIEKTTAQLIKEYKEATLKQ